MKTPKIAVITGASGLVGSALQAELSAQGYTVRTLVRRTPTRPHEFYWNLAAGELDARVFDGASAVFHLAGRNIAARWTPQFKATMAAERAQMMQLLGTTLRTLKTPPPVLVVASAIGIYQPGAEERDETAAPAEGWLPGISKTLEAPLNITGLRQVSARLGVVLGPTGGALAKMLLPFKLGLGGPVGGGMQRMSIISSTDAARALVFLAETPQAAGAINVVGPAPVAQAEFAITLGRVLGRPALLPMPAWAVKLIFGEMGEALLLNDLAVLPTRLLKLGFHFKHPTPEAMLRGVLGR